MAPSASVDVIRSTNNIDENGRYEWSYETGTGLAAQEQGVGGQSAQGSYRWVSPEGQQFEITYVADENGYRPSGAALPVAPPVPEAIARALVWIQQHPYDEAAANARAASQANAHKTLVG